jgi:hypothetical protein
MANQVFSGSSNSKAAEAASEQPPAANEVQQLVDSLSGILEEGSEERLAKSSVRKESLSLRSLLGGFYERIAALEETEKDRAQSFKEIRFFFSFTVSWLSPAFLTLLVRSIAENIFVDSQGVMFDLGKQEHFHLAVQRISACFANAQLMTMLLVCIFK